MNDSFRVLFVCTGNICRSPMAEGLLRHILPERLKSKVTVSSAGTHAVAGNPAEPLADLAAQERGFALSAHQAAAVEPEMLAATDMILVMEKLHAIAVKGMLPAKQGRVRLLGEYHPSGEVVEIPDPYGGNLAQYRRSLKLIDQCVSSLAGFLDMLID